MEQSTFIEKFNVNGIEFPVIEYKNRRVITLKDIDRVHQRIAGTARKRFNENKDRFIEDTDFFTVPYEEWHPILNVRKTDDQNLGGRRGSITFVTEDGYLMLVKSFSDELAWKVQRRLVNAYFRVQEEENTTRKRKARQKSALEIMSTAAVRADKLVKVMGLSDPARILKIGEIVKSETGKDLFEFVNEPPPDPNQPTTRGSLSPDTRRQDILDRLLDNWYARWADHPVLVREVATLLDEKDRRALALSGKSTAGANRALAHMIRKAIPDSKYSMSKMTDRNTLVYRIIPVETANKMSHP